MEKLGRGKDSSLLRKLLNYSRKKFYNIDAEFFFNSSLLKSATHRQNNRKPVANNAKLF